MSANNKERRGMGRGFDRRVGTKGGQLSGG